MGDDQDATIAGKMVPIEKIEPCAAARHERAKRCAKATQPLVPDRAIGWQAACELRDLPPVRVRRPECPASKAGAVRGAEHAGADRIGPQDPRSVGRPQPDGKRTRCMNGELRIGEASHLEFRMVHCIDGGAGRSKVAR